MRAHAEELEKSYFQLNGFISQDCHSWGLGFEIRSSKLYVSYTLGSYIPSTQTFLGPSDSRLCCIGGCEHLSGTANVDVWWGMGFLGGPAKMGILCSYKPFFQNDCYLCCAVKKLLLVKALVSLNLCKACIYTCWSTWNRANQGKWIFNVWPVTICLVQEFAVNTNINTYTAWLLRYWTVKLPSFWKSMIQLVRTIAPAKDKSTANNVTKQKAPSTRSNKSKAKALGFFGCSLECGGLSQPIFPRHIIPKDSSSQFSPLLDFPLFDLRTSCSNSWSSSIILSRCNWREIWDISTITIAPNCSDPAAQLDCEASASTPTRRVRGKQTGAWCEVGLVYDR